MVQVTTKKVAIIGGGVSGLASAWHLTTSSPEIEVCLFESTDRLGGHAHTTSVTPSPGEKPIDVDMGFMIFNNENYPNMCRWFDEMGVQSQATNNSLSVSLDEGKTVEWSSEGGLSGLLANPLQLFKPSFYRFLRDMVRFNDEAAGDILSLSTDDPRRHVTIGQYLRQKGYSEAFATHYLLPMTAALWSSSLGDVLNFPAAQLIGFMCNHKMLQIFDRPEVCVCVCLSVHFLCDFANILVTRKTILMTLWLSHKFPFLVEDRFRAITSVHRKGPLHPRKRCPGIVPCGWCRACIR